MGNVTLGFSNPFVDAALNFNVSGTAPNGAVLAVNGTFDPNLDVQTCTILIDADDNQADICRAGEQVIYTIRDRNGATATNYTGTIVLNNDLNIGNYAPIGENVTFYNTTTNNCFATYAFNTSDNGLLTLT